MEHKTEAWVQFEILQAWGSHARVRFARINTGVGWFNKDGPCRRSDKGARPVRFNPPGTADIVGLIAPSGRMLMIECKSATGAQRDDQASMQTAVESFGGLYVLARSIVDVDVALAAEGITR